MKEVKRKRSLHKPTNIIFFCVIQGPSAFHADLFVSHRGPNLFIPKKNKAAFLYGCLQREEGKSSSLGAYKTTLGERRRRWRRRKGEKGQDVGD